MNNSGAGQYDATSSRSSTGLYVLSFPSIAPKTSFNLTALWSPNFGTNFLVAMNSGNTQSTATVRLRDSGNNAVEGVVSFAIWAAP